MAYCLNKKSRRYLSIEVSLLPTSRVRDAIFCTAAVAWIIDDENLKFLFLQEISDWWSKPNWQMIRKTLLFMQ